MKLAYYEAASTDEEQLTSSLPQVETMLFPTYLDGGHLPTGADTIDLLSVFVDSRVSATVLDALPNLKLIVARSTGYDHIDINTCEKRGITVCNVPSYGQNTVAEHAFALILAL